MWQRVLPDDLPRDDVDLARLAEADLSGGGITSAALQAAYLGAADGGRVGMDHLTRALRWEMAKTGRAATSPPKGRRPSA